MIEFDDETGLWWPQWESRKKIHFDYHTRHLVHAERFIEKCENKRIIFQAGGNVGIWPNYFAKHFDVVISAEADPDLFRCMDLNKSPGVSVIDAAIGDAMDEVSFERTGKSGTGKVSDHGMFHVKQITIDSLNLQKLDAIYIDIEGYEDKAIKGALDTIQRCRPLICLETFDRTREALNGLMEGIGYKAIMRHGRDQTYAPK
jgi:FkbM family methyltransferase